MSRAECWQRVAKPLPSVAPATESRPTSRPPEPASSIDDFVSALVEGIRRVSADADLSYELTLRDF